MKKDSNIEILKIRKNIRKKILNIMNPIIKNRITPYVRMLYSQNNNLFILILGQEYPGGSKDSLWTNLENLNLGSPCNLLNFDFEVTDHGGSKIKFKGVPKIRNLGVPKRYIRSCLNCLL